MSQLQIQNGFIITFFKINYLFKVKYKTTNDSAFQHKINSLKGKENI